MKFGILAIACGGSLASAIATGSAQAQSAPNPAQSSAAPEAPTVGEVVVTAQRRSENIINVPMTVNAFSQSQIAARGIANLTDLSVQAPGLRFSEFANAGNISVRGVGTAFVSGNGESSVALYLDGVFIPQAKALGLGQFDLGGIEVLRGPQGTLYGRNSTGGVINMTSAPPARTAAAGLTVGFGNYDDRKISGYVSGPLGDRVRARLYLDGERRDGFVENTFTGQHLNDLHAYSGRLSVDADVTDRWLVQARLTTRDEKSANPVFDSFDPNFVILSAFGLPPSVTQPNFDPYKVNTPTHYSGDRKMTIGSLKNTFDITDNIVLSSLTGVSSARFDNTYDTLGTVLPYPISALATSKAISQEINLHGKAGPLDWVTGLYYFNQRYTLNNTSTPPAGLGPTSRNAQEARQESYSAFADATYDLTSDTHVFGGLRASREKVHQELAIYDETPAGEVLRCPAPGGSLDQRLQDDALTGRLGLRHDLASEVNVYVQASHGYKAPSFSQSNCNNPFQAETVNAFEAGLKGRFWDEKVVFTGSFFFNDITNLQLEIASPLGIAVENAPKARSYGAEFSVTATPVRSLTVDANLSLMHARYTAHFPGDANLSPTLTSQDIDGNALNNAPDVSGYVGVEYKIDLGEYGSLTPRAEVQATSKYNLREVTFPWTVQGGYATGNFFATYRTRDGHYAVRAWIKNASNKAILGGVLGFGGALGSYLPPRMFGVDITATY